MGIFSRFRDIINSNINAMLDKAEDPEKLIKLMIQEMEDTLVEIKASCAGAMASRARVQRSLDEARRRAEDWEAKARLAIEKGREDLAREALAEKRHFTGQVEGLERECDQLVSLIERYQDDIVQLEEKLESARKKHRVLVQRHIHAGKRNEVQKKMRKIDTTDAFTRFESFESRIERMEAEADLVNYGRKPSLEDEIESLHTDDDIENELQELKKKVSNESDLVSEKGD